MVGASLLLTFATAVAPMASAQAPPPRPAAPATRPAPGKPSAAPQPRRAAPRTAPKPGAPAPAVTAPVAPAPVPPDVQFVTTHVTGEIRTTGTVQLKGARARIALGENLVSLQQCDQKRAVQLNTQTGTWLAARFDSNQDAPGDALGSRKRGGLIRYATVVTDTGETQAMSGMTAHHLRVVVTKEASASACDKTPQRVETEGWYVDLPDTVTCAVVPPREISVQADPQHPECVDEVRYERPIAPIGYPLKYSTVSTIGDQPPVTTTMEVTAFERVEVPAVAVDVPADYVEVRTVAQLTADHRPGEPGVKKPGTIRVGLVPVANRTPSSFEISALNDALLESFSETELDIVRLQGASAADLEADARAKQVDLLLTSTIAEVKVPRGGLVGRINGSSGEAYQAKVDYALAAPGQAKPAQSGSERSGGSTLNSAINLARKVAQFAPPLMMAKYGYMNAYGSMLSQGGPSGAMRQTPDPVMNMAFSLLDRATAPRPTEQFTTEEGAVASALEKVIKSVVGDVGKMRK